MPPPASTDEFVDLVRKSGVTDEARIQAYLSRLTGAGGMPTSPTQLAELMIRDGLLTHFQAEQLLQGKWKRFFVGKYKVLEKLGSGGMGQVFLCEHKLMRRRVAVKVLPTPKTQDNSSIERFYREAKAVAAMDHPNIVRAYDIDQDDHLHFLVMEYVDGTNLHDLVRRSGPLDPVRAAHYIYGAAVGLQHAHEMGLVHRDIKPGNILVDRSGVVKILDMGLARFYHDDEDHLTRKYDENILGTADYLAPEQAIDSHKVDIRADIYSLGGTFYYLLTGRAPFPEGTVAQKLLWHQTREPASIRSLRPEVPEELAAIVERMMAKEPAHRPQTPAEVMAALAVWVQVPISPPSEAELPRLSLAAMGASGPQTARGSGPATPGPLVAPATPASGHPRPAQPRSTPAVTPATAIAPVAPRAQVAAQPQAAAAAADVWGELAADTRTDVKKDTTLPDRSSQRIRTAPTTSSGHRRLLLFVILGGVLGLGLLATAAVTAYLLFGRGDSSSVSGPGEARKLYVTTRGTSPDPDRTLTSLAKALDVAGPGDVVVILDERIEDRTPVRIFGRAVKKGVRVEAGTPSKVVTWAPRAGGGQQSVLEISDIENFQISGLVIEANGQDIGIVAGRSCPGLVLENVEVRAPRQAGFRFIGLSGEPGRPARLTGCRVTAAPKVDGIQFQSGARHVVIENCRLEGPGQVAFKVEGPISDLELRGNRITNFELGLALSGKPPEGLTLNQNHFAATKQIATSQTPPGAGFKSSGNTRDSQSAEGSLTTGATVGSPPP